MLSSTDISSVTLNLESVFPSRASGKHSLRVQRPLREKRTILLSWIASNRKLASHQRWMQASKHRTVRRTEALSTQVNHCYFHIKLELLPILQNIIFTHRYFKIIVLITPAASSSIRAHLLLSPAFFNICEPFLIKLAYSSTLFVYFMLLFKVITSRKQDFSFYLCLRVWDIYGNTLTKSKLQRP